MSDIDSLVFSTPARVHARALDANLLDLAKQRGVLDPAVFDERVPFFWQNEISSTRLDAYFTAMDADTTLANFAADAADGRAFLAGHNSRVLPFGYTLTGTKEIADGVTRVLADAYTFADLELGGVKTNDFIFGARAGILRDTSVGFYGGSFICSICQRDMLRDWDCWHVPGFEYEVEESGSMGTRGAKVMKLATARVTDAHLAEVSAVYDGATPGAAILKAEQQAEQGRIKPEQARILEARYRIHLPGVTHVHRAATIQQAPADRVANAESVQPSEEPMSNQPQETQQPADEQRHGEGARTPADEQRSADSALVAQARQALGNDDVMAAIRALRADNERLRPLADDGHAYRTDLVTDALAEGVRAAGPEFAEETYRALLKDAPLSTIKRMRDDWKAIANTLLVGGRQTVDEDQRATETLAAPAPQTPNEAYS